MKVWYKWLSVLFGLCCLVLLSGCAGAAVSTQPTKTLRIGILRVPNDVAAARQMGTLKQTAAKYGYKIQYITFDSGVDANKALLSGGVDMATMGHTNAVVAMSAKIPAKLVWINDVIGSNERLVVKNSAGIHSWNDLKGKRIATPFASTSHYSLMMSLKAHHLLGKVQLLDMQTTEIVAAWRRGDIDGTYTWEPSLSNLTNSHTLIDSTTLADEGHLTANVTLASNAFIQQHPKVLRAVLHTLGQAHDLYHSEPQKIYQSTAGNIGLSTAEAKTQIGTSKWIPAQQMGTFTHHVFQQQFYNTCAFMWHQQTLSNAPSMAECRKFCDWRLMDQAEEVS